MTKHELIRALVQHHLDRRLPQTQYECCLLGARCSVAVGSIPANDAEFIDAAYGAAMGLFGPAFEAADYAQKTQWIDMCERALREVAGAAAV